MRVEVLVSCMHQADNSIVQRSRITGDALIINQCGRETLDEVNVGNQRIRMVSTKQRGLSNSRNMAIQLADRDICLLCDDDEEFAKDYASTIIKSFCRLANADIIAFQVENKTTRLTNKIQKVGYLKSLRLSSVQLAFRRTSILARNITFDPLLGAGSGNGSMEEIKFLWDCLKAGLKIYYVPKKIARLRPSTSTWFTAYDEKFFTQRGATTRYIMGTFFAVAYGIYYLLAKYRMYRKTISFRLASLSLFHGILRNPITKGAQ